MFNDTACESSQVNEMSADPCLLQRQNVSTETIDVNNLLTTDVCSTGSFDLRSIESTSLGKLVDAMPLPVLVVDQWHHVVFANQACEKASDGSPTVGRTFEELIPTPGDAERAHQLTGKAVQVLENAFDSRKPHTTEAILHLGKKRRWYRLHLRSVRFASQRHVLVVMQDLTSERTHERIIRSEEQRLRNGYSELKMRHMKLVEQFRIAENMLSREIALRKRAETREQTERERLLEILLNAPLGLAIVGPDGSVTYANEPFKELFNERCDNPLKDLPGRLQSELNSDYDSESHCTEIGDLTNNTDDVSQTSFFAVPAEGGEAREVQITTSRLSNGEHVIICAYM